jgi:hypothetical protein
VPDEGGELGGGVRRERGLQGGARAPAPHAGTRDGKCGGERGVELIPHCY